MLDPDTERAVRAFLAKAARQYDVTGAILFGSRARRGHRPDSDADGACNRACYAMHDAARAALLATGAPVEAEIARTHRAV